MASNRRVEIKRGIGRREVGRIKKKRIKKRRERETENMFLIIILMKANLLITAVKENR